MILDFYIGMRTLFALPGADVAIDGLPEWPASMVGANGFDGGIDVSPNEVDDIIATCNAGDVDAVSGEDEYDWFCSVRTEHPAGKPLVFSPLDGKSGSLLMSLSAWAAELYPEPTARSTTPLLFGGCFLYVRRRSDGAVQTLDLAKYFAANFAQDD